MKFGNLFNAIRTRLLAMWPAANRYNGVTDSPPTLSAEEAGAFLANRRPRPKNEPLRCRAGDLAVIVRCRSLPSAVGKLVHVERPAMVEAFDWLVSSCGEPFDFEPPRTELDGWLHIRDGCLRPIRGNFDHRRYQVVIAESAPVREVI